ncbi:MAG: MltR family transcriptional regulator [Ahrensia sp.]
MLQGPKQSGYYKGRESDCQAALWKLTREAMGRLEATGTTQTDAAMAMMLASSGQAPGSAAVEPLCELRKEAQEVGWLLEEIDHAIIQIAGTQLQFAEMIRLQETAQTAHVMLVVGTLDVFMEKILRASMPHLEKRLGEKLFDGYGPFSTFSAKIDVVYALGLIDRELCNELHTIRAIRNKFAHPEGSRVVTFQDEVFKGLFQKLPDYQQGTDRQSHLTMRFRKILEILQQKLVKAYSTAAMQRQRETNNAE